MVFARFHIAMVTSPTNPKSSIVVVKSIAIEGEKETYLFPEEAQPIALHKVLLKNPTVAKNAKAMTQRSQNRRVRAELTGELENVYLDGDGNVQFEDYFITEDTSEQSGPTSAKAAIEQTTTEGQKKTLQSITKDMVLAKYSNKSQNAEVWLRTFNAECDRLQILQDRRAEAMRLFLDKYPLDWFNTQWTNHHQDTWEIWTHNFLEAFGDNGWNMVWSAINYKHLPGTSIFEYIIKKNSLLVDALPELNEKCRVAIICVGIERETREKIDRNSITTQGKLLSEIVKWDNPQNNNKSKKSIGQLTGDEREKVKEGRNGNGRSSSEKKPCSWCEKRGYMGKYHPEKVCWNNPSNPDYREKGGNNRKGTGMNSGLDKTIRVANNTELEGIFNENVNAKN